MRYIKAILYITILFSYSAAVAEPLFIFGGHGHKEFLGCLNCNSIHPKSVWNGISQFGFDNDFGVWNSFGQFINPFSSYSMCNEFASDPPIIVDDTGQAYGRMSINEFFSGSICGFNGNEKLCKSIRLICKSKN